MATHDAATQELARLPSGVSVSTTIHTYGGERSGPTVYVQAAQHGREVNGTATLRRVHNHLLDTEITGTVHAVPVANPLTFDLVSYTTPEAVDSVNHNMNRVWPGDESGTIHERMAETLWSLASEADYLIDLHTGGRDMASHVVFEEGDEECRRLAEAFGTDLLLGEPAGDDASAEWHDRDFAGKLRVAAREADIPAITPELAHNRAIVESAVELGVTGVYNVLREVGVLPGPPEENGATALGRNHLGRVEAAESGLFRPATDREVGEQVSAGTYLGTVFDPSTFEEYQTVEADRDGILYSLNREAIVTAGSTVANVAELR